MKYKMYTGSKKYCRRSGRNYTVAVFELCDVVLVFILSLLLRFWLYVIWNIINKKIRKRPTINGLNNNTGTVISEYCIVTLFIRQILILYNVYNNMSGGSVYDSRIVFLRENLKFVLHSIPFATSDDDNNKHHPNVRFAEFILRYYYSLLYGYNFMCLL